MCVCVCVQVSPEEEQSLKTDSWENPVFENLDQLMEERYYIIDCINYILVMYTDLVFLILTTAKRQVQD